MEQQITSIEIKNRKVMLYLTKAVIYLNSNCNNIIKEEKFQRAIAMFCNRNEDFETIKAMIDWHVVNEEQQYLKFLKDQQKFSQMKKQSNVKSLNKLPKNFNQVLKRDHYVRN